MNAIIEKLFGPRTPDAPKRYRDLIGKLAAGTELGKVEAAELERIVGELNIDRPTFQRDLDLVKERDELLAFIRQPFSPPAVWLPDGLKDLDARQVEQEIEVLKWKLHRLRDAVTASGSAAGAAVHEHRRQCDEARRRINEIEDERGALFAD